MLLEFNPVGAALAPVFHVDSFQQTPSDGVMFNFPLNRFHQISGTTLLSHQNSPNDDNDHHTVAGTNVFGQADGELLNMWGGWWCPWLLWQWFRYYSLSLSIKHKELCYLPVAILVLEMLFPKYFIPRCVFLCTLKGFELLVEVVYWKREKHAKQKLTRVN